MALADQFASIGQLMARLDGGAAPARPPGSGVAPKLPVQSPAQVPAQKKNGDVAATVAPPEPPPGHTPEVDAAEDDDDALPSVGRVWEGPGPSLGAILKQHAAKSAAPPPPPPPGPPPASDSNVEPVSPTDLPAVWKALLQLLSQHGPGLHSLLSHGRLVAIEDGRAVIRYGPQHETFVKMLDRNGKKDLVRDAIGRVLRQSIGVRFEIDEAPEGEPEPAAAPGSAPAPVARTGSPEVTRPAAPPPTPAVKITPELIESIRAAEPLVRALMDELGAQIVKVE
jgi:hypothetical protein